VRGEGGKEVFTGAVGLDLLLRSSARASAPLLSVFLLVSHGSFFGEFVCSSK
jgi:hypothetical protein